MGGEEDDLLPSVVHARVLRLLGDVTCVSTSPRPVGWRGKDSEIPTWLPEPKLLPMPNTDDVAFFYELMAATRSGIKGPSGLPGNTFPNPIDIDGDESWWAWWRAASASEIRAGLPGGWARELGSTEAGYLGICARLVSSCLVSLLFGQWKLSAATYPESWFTGGYSLSERFADRTRMNLDVLALSEVRAPAHPVTATIWQGRQRAEASRLPPRVTRFTALEGDNPFRRLRGGLSGRSVLGKLMGLPESPDSLVFPLRWATAMHTSLAYLGWVAARYSDASAACLYPFIPWMASPSARDEIDAALGPAEGVALGAVADGLASLAAAWFEAAARFAEDSGLPDATAWADRRKAIPAEFSLIRARSGLVSLLGSESGSTSALASVLQLLSTSDLTTIELVPLAQVRAWLKTAREARFADEGPP